MFEQLLSKCFVAYLTRHKMLSSIPVNFTDNNHSTHDYSFDLNLASDNQFAGWETMHQMSITSNEILQYMGLDRKS